MSALLLFSGPCTSRTAAEVRRRIASAPVAALVSAPVREDLTLAATELLTNAVRAGASAVDVALHVSHRHIELDVTDDAPGRPERQQPGPDDVHGRGLQILDAVAAQWGHRPTAPGKTVWARFAMS
ncbi:MAG: putative sensor protein [Pseudonocardiales bacterium]|nr:putative sensor protein [Jatrophihabitantaceae bacterium]MCW2603166.1 putative sensor protein [Pseudonocardiales bacterium]